MQEALKGYIAQEGLTPGDPLPAEAELARQLGVSRNSVREAVKSLETVGILETRRGTGVFVGSFSFDALLDTLPYGLMLDGRDLTDMLDVRAALESAMIEKAVAVRDDAQIARIDAALSRMRDAVARDQSISDADRAFHLALYSNVGNRVLLRLIDIFWQSFHRAAESLDLGNRVPLATYEDHLRIADAFKSGDATATRAMLDRHYDGIRSLLAGGDAPRSSPS